MKFLYQRLPGGISSTLIVSSVAGFLVYFELSLQGLQLWVSGWFALLCFVLFSRYLLMLRFQNMLNSDAAFDSRFWHRAFLIGAVFTGAILGMGVALSMPFVTKSAQVMLHLILLGVSVGAIAFLSTSLLIYVCYMVVTLLPITLWLLSNQRLDAYILGFMTFYLMMVISLAVRRMNSMIRDSQYYRFENQLLMDDLRSLLDSVSESNKALEKISVTDDVTGLSNFRAFRIQLETLLRERARIGKPMAVAKISIDYFYEYNLSHGQQSGDELLRQIARIIESNLTSSEQIVARLQGAEFALLMPETELTAARTILDQVIEQVRNRKIEHRNSRVGAYVSLSIGVGFKRIGSSTSAKNLLELADIALRQASERGRNRVEVVQD